MISLLNVTFLALVLQGCNVSAFLLMNDNRALHSLAVHSHFFLFEFQLDGKYMKQSNFRRRYPKSKESRGAGLHWEGELLYAEEHGYILEEYSYSWV